MVFVAGLGGLGGSWASLGPLLGGLGVLFGHSWIGLGGSWVALGRLLGDLEAVLDRSWVVLGRHGSLRVMLEPTNPREPSHWEAFGGPR